MRVDNTGMITDPDFLEIVGQSCPLCGAPAPGGNLCQECQTLTEAVIELRRRALASWGSAAG